jgi:hypothetical protein
VAGFTFLPSFDLRVIEVMQLDEISQRKINWLTTAASGQKPPPIFAADTEGLASITDADVADRLHAACCRSYR